MRKFLLFLACVAGTCAYAQSTLNYTDQHGTIHFKDDSKNLNFDDQNQLPSWQNFKNNHERWSAVFNQSHALPHRAFGPGIVVPGNTALEKSNQFISSELEAFGIRQDLLTDPISSTIKNQERVFYKQIIDGLEVLNSSVQLKYNNGLLVMMSLDYYYDAQVPQGTQLEESVVVAQALEGLNLNNIEISNLGEALLPRYINSSHIFHHVSKVEIKGYLNTTPVKYHCLLDVLTGELLLRENQVWHIDAKKEKKILNMGMPVAVSGTVSGTVHALSPYDEQTVETIPNIYLEISGDQTQADLDGAFVVTDSGPTTLSATLAGPWSRIYSDGVTPSFSGTIQDGFNALNIDDWTNVRERSAYRSVNAIHDHMKVWLPDFTGLDNQLTTNIDVEGECNAFYNGTSINFYDFGGGCNATSLIADVVYHEYGHGINDWFYQSLGGFFSNGAMNEGYADFWGMSLTQSGLLGIGFNLDDEEPLRRYDQDRKVYPDDIVAEVHADGEIICGAWYDTHLLMGGDWDQTMELFIGAYDGLQANTNNGNEGAAFSDVLLDALQADDDDADLTNGTPNGAAILEGFLLHGITLLSAVDLEHQPVLEAPSDEAIVIDAIADIFFPYSQYFSSVNANYQILPDGEWLSIPMEDNEDGTFTASLDPQVGGVIIAYYITMTDVFDQQSAVTPVGATKEVYPNLPNFILVNFLAEQVHDGDDFADFGSWQMGVNGDNATTGEWEEVVPIGSYSEEGDPATIVAPNSDHTPGGGNEGYCFVTGNSPNLTAGVGTNDVDDGHTTLRSQSINLTSYEDPAFAYWRWFANAPATGANPESDWWQVSISDDDGENWVQIENTLTQDISWRRNVFKVSDYLDITEDFRIQFVASDSLRIGENLDGGSLIEAAIDDIVLYDVNIVGVDEVVKSRVQLFPNPASEQIQLRSNNAIGDFRVTDAQGRVVLSGNANQQKTLVVDISQLAPGLYNVQATDISSVHWTKSFVKD